MKGRKVSDLVIWCLRMGNLLVTGFPLPPPVLVTPGAAFSMS
jgi:hypothetical protein